MNKFILLGFCLSIFTLIATIIFTQFYFVNWVIILLFALALVILWIGSGGLAILGFFKAGDNRTYPLVILFAATMGIVLIGTVFHIITAVTFIFPR